MTEGMAGLLTLPRTATSRMALLEAIARLGSISAAGRAAGLSYKGAWDNVQALNNLFEGPLVIAAPGGKSGGGASVTPLGLSVLGAFRRVQAQMETMRTRLGDAPTADILWSLGMKTSARNAFRGQIVRITEGAVSAEVTLRLTEGLEIVAVVTLDSIETLGLIVGGAAIALIKSSFVVLAQGENLRTSARNQITGRVASREDGVVNSEITLDLGAAKTLVATITLESVNALGIAPGDEIVALVKAPHVILAVE